VRTDRRARPAVGGARQRGALRRTVRRPRAPDGGGPMSADDPAPADRHDRLRRTSPRSTSRPSPHLPDVELVAVADLDAARAEAVASEHEGVRALGVDELIADPEVDTVLNLTIPAAHAEVDRQGDRRRERTSTPRSPSRSTTEPTAPPCSSRGRGAAGVLVGSAPGHRAGHGHADGARGDRRGPDRRPDRGDRHHAHARPRALAPPSRLLLRARRRSAAGHGPVLHPRARDAAGAGRRGDRRGLPHPLRADHRLRSARRGDHPGQHRHARHRDPRCTPPGCSPRW
jgi:hypothetical protein